MRIRRQSGLFCLFQEGVAPCASSCSAITKNATDDCLKIDRSLVNHLRPETRNAAIVRSTVQLGQNLGLTIVAEGVETPDQIELLRQFGCHQAQGFGVARPMPAEEVMAWVIVCRATPDARSA
jgi:EAL domain-containing protein (putative c-di-GMP-specific phosphodiesterase class I)